MGGLRNGADGTLSVTAPSPGCPTPLDAGSRLPLAVIPSIEGIGAAVGRVTLAVIPPGQSADVWLDPDGKCRSHSIRARSVSIAKTPPELPPTKASDRNPLWLMRKSSKAGAVNALPLRASLGRSILQRKRKSGDRTVSGAVLMSALTHDERCASAPNVVQSSDQAAAARRTSATASEPAILSLEVCIGFRLPRRTTHSAIAQ